MRSSTLLWALALAFVGAIIWLAVTGRLEAGAHLFVDKFWGFFENIARTLRR